MMLVAARSAEDLPKCGHGSTLRRVGNFHILNVKGKEPKRSEKTSNDHLDPKLGGQHHFWTVE
jgi:hypothetical protein